MPDKSEFVEGSNKDTASATLEIAPSTTANAYYSEAEVSEILQKFEEKYDLLKYTVDGWCAWPLFRFAISRQLQAIPFEGTASPGLTRMEILAHLSRDLVDFLSLRHARYLVKTYSSNRTDEAD